MVDIKAPRVVIPQAAECVRVFPDTGATADIPGEGPGGNGIKGDLVRALPSGPGLEIQDGSDTRSFVTAEMLGGVPTGNFS